jgi:hypothetical protein
LNRALFFIQQAVFYCLAMSGTWSKQLRRNLK